MCTQPVTLLELSKVTIPLLSCLTPHRSLQVSSITIFYRTFGWPIICTDTYSQCYFGHWHPQQCFIQSSSLVGQDAIYIKASNDFLFSIKKKYPALWYSIYRKCTVPVNKFLHVSDGTLDKCLRPLLAMIGWSIIYMDTIHIAILFTNTSTMFDITKHIH